MGDLGLHPLRIPPDPPLRAPRQQPGHGRTAARPLPAPAGTERPPQLLPVLPVTPLGDLGTIPAADTPQTPFLLFFSSIPIQRQHSPAHPQPRYAPFALRHFPTPLERARKGLRGFWRCRNLFPFQVLKPPASKCAKICELTPKRSCFGGGKCPHPAPSVLLLGTALHTHHGDTCGDVILSPLGTTHEALPRRQHEVLGAQQAEGAPGAASVRNCR